MKIVELLSLSISSDLEISDVIGVSLYLKINLKVKKCRLIVQKNYFGII